MRIKLQPRVSGNQSESGATAAVAKLGTKKSD
jgi:hypothetical protein